MKALFYSHDTYGLGHIQRTLNIARQLAHDAPQVSMLMVTGSQFSNALAMPAQLDFMKLPSIVKDPSGGYRAQVSALAFPDLLAMRDNLLFETIKRYAPDVIVVDKAPAGVHGELVRTFDYVKAMRPATRIVLGMRDIEDDAAETRAAWAKQGIYPLLEKVYDHILLYGSRSMYDPVREYGLSGSVASKIIECGHVAKSEPTVAAHDLRGALKMKTNRLVVVTAGGGGDGYPMMRAYAGMLQQQFARGPLRWDTLMVTGPFMSAAEREDLMGLVKPGLHLTVMPSSPDLYSWLNAADFVVAMGGYNTVVEVLSLRKPAVIVPRVSPRVEQLIRAEWLHEREVARMLHPDLCTPERLGREVADALSGAHRFVPPVEAGVDMRGAQNASHAILSMMRSRDQALSIPFIPRKLPHRMPLAA
jgi:predicted glycosyltransferase